MNRRTLIKMMIAPAILPVLPGTLSAQAITPAISVAQINQITEEVYLPHVQSLFERDDAFYRAMRK